MDKKLVFIAIVAAVMVGIFSSCKKDNVSFLEMRKNEVDLRERYIAKFHSDASPTESGLYFLDHVEGTGEVVEVGDNVKVFYSGYLIEDSDTAGVQDGYMFDFREDYEPLTFNVGYGIIRAVAGFEEALLLMKEGAEAKLVIPSRLGYANRQDRQGIPPYSNLVFYIKVYKVMKAGDTGEPYKKALIE
jgi:FKBP-type peptidyl-prolyl cis-trans isomerase